MNTKWQVSPEVISSKIDEEVVLMSIQAESYFALDPIGSEIWEYLSEKPLTITELVTIFIESYAVEEENCRNDVQEFIQAMTERKLIFPVQ